MARRRWSAETKAKAAADLTAGMTVRDVAAKYDMPVGTVSHLTPTSRRGAVYVSRLGDINDLQRLFLEQLEHSFAALTAMTDLIVAEPKFAAEHGSHLAVLYGVVFDKTGKIAAAAMAGSELARQRLGELSADGDPPDAAPAAAPPGAAG